MQCVALMRHHTTDGHAHPPEGHALMQSLACALRALAQDAGVAVLVTNHTVSGREGDAPGSLKPALGETWKSQRAWATRPNRNVQLRASSHPRASSAYQPTRASSSRRALKRTARPP